MASPTTAEHIRGPLCYWLANISDENYDQTFAYFRLWVDISQAYFHGDAVRIHDCLYDNRGSSAIDYTSGELIHPTAHLIIRFARDAESDHIISQDAGHQAYLCARILSKFFDENMRHVWAPRCNCSWQYHWGWFCTDANYVAHFVNTGHVKEPAIRNHILQSLISCPEGLLDHQADALIILFKLAGATFEKYADPSVVDRCFELLKDHYTDNPVKDRLVQEVIWLRNNSWEVPEPQILKPQFSEPDPATGPEVEKQRRKRNPKKVWAMFSSVFGPAT